MKSIFRSYFVLSFALGVFILVMIGNTPAIRVSATMAQSSPKSIVKLKWADYPPMTEERMVAFKHFVDRVAEISGGQVEIGIFPNEQLVKSREQLEAVMRGSIDMTSAPSPWFPSIIPLLNIVNEPTATSAEEFSRIISMTRDHLIPEFERLKLKLLFSHAQPRVSLLSAEKPLRHPNDMEGMKIRAPGIHSGFVKAWGAAPVSIPQSEIYMALQRGVCDGVYCGMNSIFPARLMEVTKFCTITPLWNSQAFVVMNYDTWNGLAANAKSWIQKAADEMAEFDANYAAKVDREIQELIQERYKEFYVVPTSGPAYNEWVDPIRGIFLKMAVQKAGSKAQEYYDAIVEAKSKYQAIKKQN